MHLFMLSILGIYGAVHAYVFMKARTALDLGIRGGILLGVFLVLMTGAPILVRVLEKLGYEFAGRVLAMIAYSWMGLLFLFFSLSILLDLYTLVIQGLGILWPRALSVLLLSPRAALVGPLILALIIALYSYGEALQVRATPITIPTAKIPATIGRVRIVQISDVHLGLMVRDWRLQRILRVIRQAQPDLLISTGDLVDGQTDSLYGLAQALEEIRPRYGKYAITGNHEFYAGLAHSLEFMRATGFTMLRGETADVGGFLTIAGIDDPAGKAFGLWRGVSETELLCARKAERFTLLLKHMPIVREEACGRFDLQLSGHTHKGQIFPFSLITRLFFPYHSGWYDLPKGSRLYVSRGTGTWGPALRFLAPPEITVIDLIPSP